MPITPSQETRVFAATVHGTAGPERRAPIATEAERIKALELAHQSVSEHFPFLNFVKAQRNGKVLTEVPTEELVPLLKVYGQLIAELKWALLYDPPERKNPERTKLL
jgi:hypothetical protein